MTLAAGLPLALLSTVALNGGFYLQHGASGSLPALTLRHPLSSLALLFTSRRWLLGFTSGLAGWGLYIAALGLAPLSLVQAISAGGVAVLALLVRVGGVRLTASERTAVTASVAGLLLLGLSLPGSTPQSEHASWVLPLVWVLSSLAGAAAAAGPVALLLSRGAGLAVASGLLYAAGDVATKAAVSGTRPIFAFALLIPLLNGLGFVSLQLAFQRGGALATAGVSSLLTNMLPIVAGIVVFGEQMPGGVSGVLRALGFGGTVLGAALLASLGQRDAGGRARASAGRKFRARSGSGR